MLLVIPLFLLSFVICLGLSGIKLYLGIRHGSMSKFEKKVSVFLIVFISIYFLIGLYFLIGCSLILLSNFFNINQTLLYIFGVIPQ